MVKFFVTIWLKNSDTKKDSEIVSTIVEKLAQGMKIGILGQINISSGGNRVTIRAETEKEDENIVQSFANAIEKETGFRAKGRLLK